MQLLKFEKVGDSYQVFAFNGVLAGNIEMADDGYMVFWPRVNGGFWEAPYLHEIANKLDELNKEWDTIVQNDPVLNGFECFECGAPIVNNVCEYCEKERADAKT